MKGGVITIMAGIAVFILGLVIVPAAVMAIVLLDVMPGQSNAVQFKVPGRAEATVDKPGRYYLWNDYRTIFEGMTYRRSSDIGNGVEIRIVNVDTGQAFDFTPAGSFSVSNGPSSSSAIGYVEVQNPCTVEIRVTTGGEDYIFSFKKSNWHVTLGLLLGTFVAAPILCLAGLGTVIWGVVKLVRCAHRERVRMAQQAVGRAAQ